ncbi:MAG: hypothetical protein WCI51_23505 [Lentisphaerota bacterium]
MRLFFNDNLVKTRNGGGFDQIGFGIPGYATNFERLRLHRPALRTETDKPGNRLHCGLLKKAFDMWSKIVKDR